MKFLLLLLLAIVEGKNMLNRSFELLFRLRQQFVSRISRLRLMALILTSCVVGMYLATFGSVLMFASESGDKAKASADTQRLTMTVISYNIHHGRGTDNEIDLARIAQVILKEGPDFVALQEVDKGTKRSGRVDQAKELGKLTGMNYHFFKQIEFEGGEYGQAILSKYPITGGEIHWLPGHPEREKRIVALASVKMPEREVIIGSTHLHHANAEFRLAQSKELTRVASELKYPAIIAGDYNASPDSEPLLYLGRDWHVSTPLLPSDAPRPHPFATFPAVDADRQIDFILGYPKNQFATSGSRVLNEPLASDHRPLLSILEIIE